MRAAILVFLAACGRLGFDATAIDDGGISDGGGDATTGDGGSDGGASDLRVQDGTSMIPTGMTSVDVPIDAVDLDHTALFFSAAVNGTNAPDVFVLGELQDGVVHFERAGQTGLVELSYYAVTWSGWDVSRGRALVSVNATNAPIPTPAYDSTRSFALASHSVASGASGPGNRYNIQSASNGQILLLFGTAANAPMTVAWQLIQLSTGTARHGGFIMTTNETARDSTILETMPVFGLHSSNAIGAQVSASMQTRMLFPSGDHFTVERGNGAGMLNVNVDTISIPGMRVQAGTASFTDGLNSTSVNITPLTSPAFVIAEGGTTDVTSNANPGSAQATIDIQDDHVRVHRGSTVGAGNISWQIVELAP